MIAGNPDPIASGLQRRERRMIGTSHSLRPAIVMKAVAERDDAARRPAGDQRRQTRQRRRGVVRRQHHATLGVRGALFEMQIGDDQHSLVCMYQCAEWIDL